MHERNALSPQWNYLRVRGEYQNRGRRCVGIEELPPRTRRIPTPPALPAPVGGTTSAYAENTFYMN